MLDIEPLFLSWGTRDSAALRAMLNERLPDLSIVPSLRSVIIATNAGWTEISSADSIYNFSVVIVDRAAKPFRLDYLDDVGEPIVVVGDQVVTDGLLAHRLNATFIEYRTYDAVPVWPRVQRVFGACLRPALFNQVAAPVGSNLRARGAAPRATDRDVARADRLQVLLTDYAMCRDDDRSLVSTQVAAFSVGVTLVGLLAAAITQTCQFATPSRFDAGECLVVPNWVLAVAPLLPIAVLALMMLYGMVATIRSYYMRALERELQQFAPDTFLALPGITPASYMGLATELMTLRRGRAAYRILANTIFVIVLVVLAAVVVDIAVHLPTSYHGPMAVSYSLITVLLMRQVMHATIGGRRLFVGAARQFLSRPVGTQLPAMRSPSRRERRLWSYLVLPRPEDLIKWLIAPGVLLVVHPAGPQFTTSFVGTWLILEYLIYEARYQWNDVIGAADDAVHPERSARGRLPIGEDTEDLRRNVAISLVVAVARVAVALALGTYLGLGSRVWWLTIAVFLTAGVYEALRRRASAGAATSVKVSIWMLVGVGYGIRAAVGLLGAGLALRTTGSVFSIAAMVAFGCMFVLLTWVLEASSYCRVIAGQPERWLPKKDLDRKGHVKTLLSYLDVDVIDSAWNERIGEYGGRSFPLRNRGAIRTPWGVAFMVAAAASALMGTSLVSLDTGRSMVAAAAAVLTAVAIARSQRWFVRVSVALTALVAELAVVAATGSRRPFQEILPFLIVVVTYVWFTLQSYYALKGATRLVAALRRQARELMSALARLVLGPSTWKLLERSNEVRRDQRSKDGAQ